MPISTQTAQPLIWLTRRCTSSRVTGEMGPLETMAPSVTRGCTASCMTATGSLILACTVRVLRPDDGSRGAGVTEKDDVELGERVGLHDDVEGDDPFAGDREHERGAHVATRRPHRPRLAVDRRAGGAARAPLERARHAVRAAHLAL